MAIKVLLQTTIVSTRDDWSIARFSMLADFLRAQTESSGERLFDVTARDRDSRDAPDAVLSTLHRSDFDQLWLFAVDTGDGLKIEECQSIAEFRRSGRGLLVTRDHMDLGSSVCGLDGVGAAHLFHTKNHDVTSRWRSRAWAARVVRSPKAVSSLRRLQLGSTPRLPWLRRRATR